MLIERSKAGTPPNFITEVFYLTMAVNHYALMRAFQFEEQVQKVIQNRQTMLEAFDADNSWQGVSDELSLGRITRLCPPPRHPARLSSKRRLLA
jgi:hypothetical protein